MSTHLHDGHRQRMRERIKKNGLKDLQPHEMLEYLLFSFIPRKDTNAIAHELINRFGSFNAVLNADVERLQEVPGMTENAALFLSTLPEVFRRYMVNLSFPKTGISGRGEVREYMRALCMGLTEEHAFAVALDAQDNVLAIEEYAGGTGDSIQLSVRNVVNFAIANKACKMIIAHNHPSGNKNPSFNDLALTKDLHYGLELVQVALLDHFIFTDNDFYSFEAVGLMENIKKRTDTLREGVWKHELEG